MRTVSSLSVKEQQYSKQESEEKQKNNCRRKHLYLGNGKVFQIEEALKGKIKERSTIRHISVN